MYLNFVARKKEKMKLQRYFSVLLFVAISVVANLFCFHRCFALGKPKTVISFLGAPGAGKGTLAEQCIKKLNYTSLSVGNLMREAITQGTPLGKQVACINEGKFVSDELVTAIIEAWFTENLDKIDTLILDGFPRTAGQAGLFLNLLSTKFNNISFRVFDFRVTDETVVQRLADRLVCKKCQAPASRAFFKDAVSLACETCGGTMIKREDDKEEIVRSRLKAYEGYAALLFDLYKQADIKVDVISVEKKTPQQVFDEFKGYSL